jgi:ABC-type glycerol-3-phosphate transport system substrate-binding protein
MVISEPVMNLYGGGLIMGKTDNPDKMVATYQWMKYITNTENSAVWSTESGYGFVRTSSADHPAIVEKRNQHVAAKVEFEKQLSQQLQEVEQTKANIQAYAGAISACDDILTTAESVDVEVPELKELETESKK